MALPLILALAGAALGAMSSKRKQDQADAQNKYRKAAIQYSPWTGMGDPGGASAPSMLEGAVGGALTGAQLGGTLGSLGGAETAAAAGGADSVAGAGNYLGLDKATAAGVGGLGADTMSSVNTAMLPPSGDNMQKWSMMNPEADPSQMFQLQNPYLMAKNK